MIQGTRVKFSVPQPIPPKNGNRAASRPEFHVGHVVTHAPPVVLIQVDPPLTVGSSEEIQVSRFVRHEDDVDITQPARSH